MAVQAGGIPLLCGMTVITGVFQALFSRVVHRLRILFPVEITGLIVTLMAIVFISYAIPNFVDSMKPVAAIRRFFCCPVSRWRLLSHIAYLGSRRLREYSIIAGILFGYACAFALDMIPIEQLTKLPRHALGRLAKPEPCGVQF